MSSFASKSSEPMFDASGLVPLPGTQVHLWVCPLAEALDDTLIDELLRLLPTEEIAAVSTFRFERDRRRQLVTRAMVRLVLSGYAGIPASQWRFGANAHGRPYVVPEGPAVPVLSFNVSHAGDYVVVALAEGREVGVDVEHAAPADAALLARRFVSPEEADALDALPAALRTARFLELWTLKESYLKARGMGLALALDSVRFAFPDADRIAVDHGTDTGPWRFALWAPQPSYRMAVCVDMPADYAIQFTMRQLVPLRYCRALDVPLLRTSGARPELSDRSMQDDVAAA